MATLQLTAKDVEDIGSIPFAEVGLPVPASEMTHPLVADTGLIVTGAMTLKPPAGAAASAAGEGERDQQGVAQVVAFSLPATDPRRLLQGAAGGEARIQARHVRRWRLPLGARGGNQIRNLFWGADNYSVIAMTSSQLFVVPDVRQPPAAAASDATLLAQLPGWAVDAAVQPTMRWIAVAMDDGAIVVYSLDRLAAIRSLPAAERDETAAIVAEIRCRGVPVQVCWRSPTMPGFAAQLMCLNEHGTLECIHLAPGSTTAVCSVRQESHVAAGASEPHGCLAAVPVTRGDNDTGRTVCTGCNGSVSIHEHGRGVSTVRLAGARGFFHASDVPAVGRARSQGSPSDVEHAAEAASGGGSSPDAVRPLVLLSGAAVAALVEGVPQRRSCPVAGVDGNAADGAMATKECLWLLPRLLFASKAAKSAFKQGLSRRGPSSAQAAPEFAAANRNPSAHVDALLQHVAQAASTTTPKGSASLVLATPLPGSAPSESVTGDSAAGGMQAIADAARLSGSSRVLHPSGVARAASVAVAVVAEAGCSGCRVVLFSLAAAAGSTNDAACPQWLVSSSPYTGRLAATRIKGQSLPTPDFPTSVAWPQLDDSDAEALLARVRRLRSQLGYLPSAPVLAELSALLAGMASYIRETEDSRRRSLEHSGLAWGAPPPESPSDASMAQHVLLSVSQASVEAPRGRRRSNGSPDASGIHSPHPEPATPLGIVAAAEEGEEEDAGVDDLVTMLGSWALGGSRGPAAMQDTMASTLSDTMNSSLRGTRDGKVQGSKGCGAAAKAAGGGGAAGDGGARGKPQAAKAGGVQTRSRRRNSLTATLTDGKQEPPSLRPLSTGAGEAAQVGGSHGSDWDLVRRPSPRATSRRDLAESLMTDSFDSSVRLLLSRLPPSAGQA